MVRNYLFFAYLCAEFLAIAGLERNLVWRHDGLIRSLNEVTAI